MFLVSLISSYCILYECVYFTDFAFLIICSYLSLTLRICVLKCNLKSELLMCRLKTTSYIFVIEHIQSVDQWII